MKKDSKQKMKRVRSLQIKDTIYFLLKVIWDIGVKIFFLEIIEDIYRTQKNSDFVSGDVKALTASIFITARVLVVLLPLLIDLFFSVGFAEQKHRFF